MDSELTCPVCQDVYCRENREPVLLPGCGHTFCRTCLRSVEQMGKVDCPTCRKPHVGTPITNLPTIFALLSLSEKYTKMYVDKNDQCASHGSPLEFWCRECQEALCGYCLLAGHLQEGHVVEKGQVFVAEKKQEILADLTQLVRDIEHKKDFIIKQMSQLVSQIALNTEESQILHSSRTEAEKILDGMLDVTCIESTLTSLGLVDSLRTGTQKIPVSRTKSIESNPCERCSFMEASTSSGTRFGESPPPVDEETEDSKEGMNTEPQSPLAKVPPEVPQGQIQETTDKVANELQASGIDMVGDGGNTASTSGMSNGPVSSSGPAAFRTNAPWPLHCCAVANDGRKGKLRWENDRLHMYCLTGNQAEAQFMIQLSVVEWLISAENPEVFLELGSEQHQLGRVYIRLYGHLRRAQHFLALCLGSLGPSYKFSKFHGVAKRGLPGETLAGGKYFNSESTLSIQGLVPGLEWGGQNIQEKRAGLVVGASGGNPYEDAFFHICTKDHEGRKFACVFGEVIDGMQVLREAVRHMLQFDVTIRDAGVILSHRT